MMITAMLKAMTPDRACVDHLCRLCDEDACGRAQCPIEQHVRALETEAR
jgi:hypothetical protein